MVNEYKQVKVLKKLHRKMKFAALKDSITVQEFVAEAVDRELKRRKDRRCAP